VDKLFERAKKLERSRERAQAQGKEAERLLRRIGEAERDAAEAGSVEALEALAGRFAPRPTPRRKAHGEGGPRRFVSADGWEILVGRNARENDRLTFRLAKGADLWLHARGASGSHVVVPAPRGKSAPPDTLVDAATLAAHYSEARGRPRVEVDYTQARYVRKPRKASPGTVTLIRSKTLDLRLEQDRLRRLKASRPPG
jgi:predicted ribosome quality control (RQC) complex YloA/Tae2 family protein